MLSRDEGIELGKSLAVGYVLDQVRGKGRTIGLALGVVVLAAAIAVLATDGVLRGAALFILVVALGALALLWLTVTVASALLRRFAPPERFVGEREAIDAAITELDLPSGPVSAVRFGLRMRRGADDEAQRIYNVLKGVMDGLV